MEEKKTLEEQTAAFRAEVEKLKKDGFEAIIPVLREIPSVDDSYVSQINQLENSAAVVHVENEPIRKDGMRRGGLMGNDATMLDYSQSVSIPIEGAGTEGLGFIPWGRHNDLPTKIFRISASLPYTAQALQYLADTATALGPRLMYQLARYSGGTVTDEMIPYENAGVWLRQRERELMEKLISLTPSEPSASSALSAPSAFITPSALNTSLRASYEQELSQIQEDYKEWLRTMEEVKEFHERNNLDQHYHHCMEEDVRLDIYFPTVGLSRGGSGKWNPRIVAIDVLDAACTRFEEKDENWKINCVYFSKRWRDDVFVSKANAVVNAANGEVVTYPVSLPEHNFTDITEYAKANQRTRVGSRQLWWCCPLYNPTPTKEYYPQPAWWSIFPSQVFQYASTLIYDKAIARKNSTMWGKILFINTSFLQTVFMQLGIEGDQEKQKEYRQKIYQKVDDFLRRRDNNGKLLVMDSYMSADEKNLIDSVRIVDVPQASEKDSDASLQIATSAVFFALGVHPALVGAEPGKTGNSGTFQRELHLLKVTQLSSRQRRYLAFLNSIARFNGWDPHAVYVIKQATLTTLDNSKTGVVETTND